MWKCPKCGREFARANQSHYCGEKPLTVDEYIAQQPGEVRPDLLQVRSILRAALSNAEERISRSMPTYWQGRNLIHFAANKRHTGLYPGDAAVARFASELNGTYAYSKGSIRIPYGQVDANLIARLATWCLDEMKSQTPDRSRLLIGPGACVPLARRMPEARLPVWGRIPAQNSRLTAFFGSSA